MKRNVKGSLFVDYVRMLRSRKDVDWTRYLLAEDLPYLSMRILPDAWYPMDTFARFGLAVIDDIAHGDTYLARGWGRLSLDYMVTLHDGLLVAGDPRESLMRLLVLRGSFFDFDPVSVPHLTDGHASVHIDFGLTARAEQAASFQTLGFFVRLVERAGGLGVIASFTHRSWEGEAATIFDLDWEPPK